MEAKYDNELEGVEWGSVTIKPDDRGELKIYVTGFTVTQDGGDAWAGLIQFCADFLLEQLKEQTNGS